VNQALILAHLPRQIKKAPVVAVDGGVYSTHTRARARANIPTAKQLKHLVVFSSYYVQVPK
jgi:hypothetical protein